jgi:hypothetical protein
METNFIGVKIGDVNGSVTANNLTSGSVENRSAFGGITLITDEQNYDDQDMISVPLRVSNFSDITGLQMTIAYDDAHLIYAGYSAEGITVNKQNFNESTLVDGAVSFSWDDINAVDLKDGQTMINLLFKTRAAGLLSESLSVNSSVTAAEVYNQDLQVGEIQWEVLDAVDNAFELLQNKPNPFTDQTEISFVLPRDMSTTLIIYNGVGKLIHSERGDYKAGFNTIAIEKSTLNVNSGILYYKLKAENFTEVKQMLLIE